MKILSLIETTKTVQYKALQITMNASHYFLAVDADGELRSHQIAPTPCLDLYWVVDRRISGPSILLGEVDLEGMDWKDTLEEYP